MSMGASASTPLKEQQGLLSSRAPASWCSRFCVFSGTCISSLLAGLLGVAPASGGGDGGGGGSSLAASAPISYQAVDFHTETSEIPTAALKAALGAPTEGGFV